MRAPGQIVMGGRRVATHNFRILGPGGGTWWVKYSWWVIPLGVIFLLVPAVGYWSGARIFSFSDTATSPTPQPIVVTPVVIQQPVPITPTTPSALGETEEAGVKPLSKPKSLWGLNP